MLDYTTKLTRIIDIILLNYRMLVGAPLGQNLQPNTTRSGALWKCPLSTFTNDCQQVITDGRKSEFSFHNN